MCSLQGLSALVPSHGKARRGSLEQTGAVSKVGMGSSMMTVLPGIEMTEVAWL